MVSAAVRCCRIGPIMSMMHYRNYIQQLLRSLEVSWICCEMCGCTAVWVECMLVCPKNSLCVYLLFRHLAVLNLASLFSLMVANSYQVELGLWFFDLLDKVSQNLLWNIMRIWTHWNNCWVIAKDAWMPLCMVYTCVPGGCEDSIQTFSLFSLVPI